MNNGNVNNNNKTNNNYVWPVRSGAWEASPRALFGGLHHSYLRCRENKRNTLNALRFEANLEENLYSLAEELSSGGYLPSRSIRFVVERPKLREIVAADFRDRVVHHFLVERLERIFEPVFIHDSYACRVGKGVHAALERTREFIRKGTSNGHIALYALHLDVKNFFMTIDKRILSGMVEDRLVKEARSGRAHGGESLLSANRLALPLLTPPEGEVSLPFLNRLAKTIIDHNPMEGRIDKGPRRLLDRIPPHKSLRYAPSGTGLPVGNLTSQFFANVYLNELDQFCKHTLKCGFYLRYCDDFLILHNDPKRLEYLREEVRKFLSERLRLELNTRYAAITDLRNGIDFIGYIIRPDYVLVRRRSVNNLRARLQKFERSFVTEWGMGETNAAPTAPLTVVSPMADKADEPRRTSTAILIRHNPVAVERLRGVLASYCGHFKWADTNRLRRAIFSRYAFLSAFYRHNQRGMPVFMVTAPQRQTTLLGQCRSLAGRFPDAAVFLQVGRYYRRLGRHHGRFTSGVRACRLDYWADERIKAGKTVIIMRETGRRFGRLLERTPAVTLLPRVDRSK